MKFSYKTQGFNEMQKVLRALPDRMATRVNAGATRKAAKEVMDAFRLAAPVGEGRHKAGHGRDNIVMKKLAGTRNFAKYVVHTGKAFWLYFYEYGRAGIQVETKETLTNGKVVFGTEVAPQPARPTFRPVFLSVAPKAFNTLAMEMSKGLMREAKKLSGEYRKAANAIGVRRR